MRARAFLLIPKNVVSPEGNVCQRARWTAVITKAAEEKTTGRTRGKKESAEAATMPWAPPFTVIYYYALQLHCLINILTGNKCPGASLILQIFLPLLLPRSVCIYVYRGDVFLCLSKKETSQPAFTAASWKEDGLLPSLLFALNIPFEQKDALRAVGITTF